MPDAKTIGKNIKRLREQHDWMQEDLAKKIGVTPKAISAWENGRACPRMGVVEKMEQAFNCTIYEIIDEPAMIGKPVAPIGTDVSVDRVYRVESKENPEVTIDIEHTCSKDALEVAKMYDNLTLAKQKDVLLYMMKLLSEKE